MFSCLKQEGYSNSNTITFLWLNVVNLTRTVANFHIISFFKNFERNAYVCNILLHEM